MTSTTTATDDFARKVRRLTDASVGTGHDAFTDVPWEDPGHALDPTDPRLGIPPFSPLARTRWYRALPPDEQARVGLQRTASAMRVGWEFENLLQQGLLVLAYRMDNEDVTFPYVHHEVMEESQHSMMFHEFVRRFAPEARGMPSVFRWLAIPLVQVSARRWPELFFLLVLGGEIPIDYLQRRLLRETELHPIVERIMAIHVEEEARHVSYANHELRRRVPAMGAVQRQALALVVPVVLGIMARMMVFPPPWLVAAHGVDRGDVRRACRHPESRRSLADSVARIHTLCRELGLLTFAARPLWRAVGLSSVRFS